MGGTKSWLRRPPSACPSCSGPHPAPEGLGKVGQGAHGQGKTSLWQLALSKAHLILRRVATHKRMLGQQQAPCVAQDLLLSPPPPPSLVPYLPQLATKTRACLLPGPPSSPVFTVSARPPAFSHPSPHLLAEDDADLPLLDTQHRVALAVCCAAGDVVLHLLPACKQDQPTNRSVVGGA